MDPQQYRDILIIGDIEILYLRVIIEGITHQDSVFSHLNIDIIGGVVLYEEVDSNEDQHDDAEEVHALIESVDDEYGADSESSGIP